MSSKIGTVYFRVRSNEEIVRQSNLEVTDQNFFNRDGSLAQAGLMSPRLGNIDGNNPCHVCRQYRNNCLGHQGHIVLTYPVINPCFRSVLFKLLCAYCPECQTVNSVSASRGTRCAKCKNLTLKGYALDEKPYNLKTKTGRILGPDELQELVAMIKPDVIQRDWGLPINPQDLLIKNLVVTAPSVRPTTIVSGQTYTDDLSIKLQTIIQVNTRLRTLRDRYSSPGTELLKGLVQREVRLTYELLAYHVFSYIDNKIAGLPVAIHRSGKAIKSLLSRIQSKDGYFRQNLGAKRTDYSARSVISPSGDLGIGSTGVSLDYAKKMSTPELVTTQNLEWYKRVLVENPVYPLLHQVEEKSLSGSSLVFRVMNQNRAQLAARLKPGSVIHRSIMTGDWVVLNRQPTLHEYGMMAHQVVVLREDPRLEGETLRINSAICPPYNADFDGDQMMSIHPSRLQAVNEVSLLMKVHQKMLDRKNGKPIIGINREKMAMMYLLSRFPRMLSRNEVVRLLGPDACHQQIAAETDSRALLSFLLPAGYCYEEEEKSGYKALRFQNGVLVRGYFMKNNCGKNSRWAQSLSNYLGSEAYNSFLERLIGVLERYERMEGLTLSVQDYCDLYEEGTVERGSLAVQRALEAGESPAVAMNLFLMNHISKFLVSPRVSKNNALVLASSGASGTILHLAQMTGLAGVRQVRGKSPQQFFTECFKPYRDTKQGLLYAKGVTKGNYLMGLPELGFLLDCMAARDGLVVANIRIRDEGYTMRKLSYSMNDLIVHQDATVRDSENRIIQLLFGGTGYNGWDYNPSSLNRRLLTLLEGLPEGDIPCEEAAAYARGQGYAPIVCDTIAIHTRYLGKSLTRHGVKTLAENLLMPIGAPVGMVAAHAIGERAGQLALDAKHAKNERGGRTRDLSRLLDKTPVTPTLYLEGDPEALRQFMDQNKPVNLGALSTVTLDAQRGQITIRPKDGLTVGQVRAFLHQQVVHLTPGCKIEERQQEVAVRFAQDYQRYAVYSQQFWRINQLVYSGYVGASHWIHEGHRLQIIARDKNLSLYRWIMRKVLPQGVTLRLLNPIYAEKVVGIQAARMILYRELMELRAQGLDVEGSYLSLLADVATREGRLKALSRSGVVADKAPLTRCAFENTRKIVPELAICSKRDYLRSPISAVICGTPVRAGPGYFSVYY